MKIKSFNFQSYGPFCILLLFSFRYFYLLKRPLKNYARINYDFPNLIVLWESLLFGYWNIYALSFYVKLFTLNLNYALNYVNGAVDVVFYIISCTSCYFMLFYDILWYFMAIFVLYVFYVHFTYFMFILM